MRRMMTAEVAGRHAISDRPGRTRDIPRPRTAGSLHGIGGEEAGAYARRPDGDQLAGVGAPRRQGRLVALRKLKGFDVLLKTMSGVFRERAGRVTLLGSAVRVDERQFARLHRLLAEVRPEPRRQRAARAVRPRRPDAERHDDRHGPADHRAVLGPGAPPRRRRAALRHRPRARPRRQRPRGLPHAAAAAAGPRRPAQRHPRRRDRHPDGHRRPAGVVAQGRAVRRPRRPARQPGPDRRAAHPHEARQRRHASRSSTSPRSSRRGRSTTRAATSASPSSSSRCSSSRPTLRGRPRHRAAALDRLGRLHRDPRRRLPPPRRRRHRSVSEAAQEAAASYTVAFERTQDTLGRLVHDLAGWMGTASTWINDRIRRGTESA